MDYTLQLGLEIAKVLLGKQRNGSDVEIWGGTKW